jgi:hypothetical protein
MKFQVPIQKDIAFTQELFALISENVYSLNSEYEKLPNKILFTGPLGKELLNFIREKEWNFKGFDLESEGGVLSALIFKYQTPLTQVEDRNSIIFADGGLNGREIEGIPGAETTQKIISAYSQPSFRIERSVEPEKTILLIRK